ncbi:hypothetical protein GCM10009744_26670 [Kribbella alba]|uniref:Transposase n=1 Tax=Kribbella alba TaxID=190197 RepID=A0ABN2F984_9ACTN
MAAVAPRLSDEARLEGVDSVGTETPSTPQAAAVAPPGPSHQDWLEGAIRSVPGGRVGREFASNQRGQTYGYPLILWVALRYFHGATHNVSG